MRLPVPRGWEEGILSSRDCSPFLLDEVRALQGRKEGRCRNHHNFSVELLPFQQGEIQKVR